MEHSQQAYEKHWNIKVEEMMRDRYGLQPNDYTESINYDLSPEEFCEWFGTKFDLFRVDI